MLFLTAEERKSKLAKTYSDVIDEMNFDEFEGHDTSSLILPAAFGSERDYLAQFSPSKVLPFPGKTSSKVLPFPGMTSSKIFRFDPNILSHAYISLACLYSWPVDFDLHHWH